MSREIAATSEAMRFWQSHFEWQYLRDFCPEINGRMLDVGCGSGHSDILLVESGKIESVVGIDINPSRIEIAKGITITNSEFHCVDICSQNIDHLGKFDSAWASHSMEHIADHSSLFTNLKRIMKPNSHLLISVPLGNAYDDAEHIHHWRSIAEITNHFEKCDINIIRATKHKENNVLRLLIQF